MTIAIGTLIDHCRMAYNAAINDTFFTDSWFFTMIWRAETELAIQGWVIEDTFTIPSVAGTREIAWPTNVLAIRELRYDYKKVNHVSLADDPKSDISDPTGDPTTYAVWDNVIIMFPTPDTSDDVIQLRAWVTPQILASSVSPLNVPDEYQIQLADFCLAQMAFKDQNIALGSVYQQKWEQCVERARQQRKRRIHGDKNFCVRNAYIDGDVTYNTGNYYYGF